MSKQKTPLQKAIELINLSKREYKSDDDLVFNKGIKSCISKIKSLLPAERQAIEQAFRDGKNDAYQLFEDQFIPSDYFTSKYN